LTVKGLPNKADYKVQIIDAAGKVTVVNQVIKNDNSMQLDIAQLPSGMYKVKFISDTTYMASFIKQ